MRVSHDLREHPDEQPDEEEPVPRLVRAVEPGLEPATDRHAVIRQERPDPELVKVEAPLKEAEVREASLHEEAPGDALRCVSPNVTPMVVPVALCDVVRQPRSHADVRGLRLRLGHSPRLGA